MANVSQTFYSITAFSVWTVTSFLSHKFAKMALDRYVTEITSYPSFMAPLIVTACQLLACFLSVGRSSPRGRLFHIMVASHGAATLATNTSLYMMFAASTLAVKLLEPVTSAIIQTIVLETKMSREAIVSIPVIVDGSVLFVGDPFASSAVANGIALAFFSNVILGIRNVSMKLAQSNHDDVIGIRGKGVKLFALGAIISTGVSYYLETVANVISQGVTYFIVLSIFSSIFHVVYSYVSVSVILHHMTVVSHAVANILKRVLVVLLLHMSGKRQASLWNWAGLVLCTCGLVLYNIRKITPQCSPQNNGHSNDGTGSATPTSDHPKTKIILLQRLLLLSLIMLGGFSVSLKWNRMTTHSPVSPYVLEDSSKNLPGVNVPATKGDADVYSYPEIVKMLNEKGNTDISDITLVSEIMQVIPRRPAKKTDDYDYFTNLFHGFINWRDGKPLIDRNITYQPVRKSLKEIKQSLSQDLLHTPHETDGLSPYLKSSRDVILEAQRVHLNLLPQVFGSRKYAILVGAAAFENKGDPAMTVGEFKTLENLNIMVLFTINVQNCTAQNFHRAMSALNGSHDSSDVTIVLQAGGFLIGFDTENACRKKALEYFRGYKAVVLPQSFFLNQRKAAFQYYVNALCCNPNLTIILRDRLSLHIAKRILNGGTRLLMAPDIAFGNGPIARFSPPLYDVLWLKRIDTESPNYKRIPEFPSHVSVMVADWLDWVSPKGSSTVETAQNIMISGLLFTQRGRVIVTDRLHGHILAVLLDIPHVLLDNSASKLSSYHNTWTRGLTNVRVTNNAEDAARMAVELLETFKDSLPKKISISPE